MVAGAAEMLQLDGPERVRQAGEKSAGKETLCSSGCGVGVSLIGHVSLVSA
jgi:hypothetical protein